MLRLSCDLTLAKTRRRAEDVSWTPSLGKRLIGDRARDLHWPTVRSVPILFPHTIRPQEHVATAHQRL